MNLEITNLDGIEFIEKDDHFIIKRFKKYFRLGKNEATMLQDLVLFRDKSLIVEKYGMKLEDLDSFLHALESTGIIGDIKEDKKNFLFYKIPIINPDKFLERIVNAFFKNKTFNRALIFIVNLIIIFGFIEYFLNLSNINSKILMEFGFKDYITLYISSIVAIFLHEIGHALSCKYYGGKVEEIGFFLIFFSPALYCDVSGIWAFKNKKEKIVTLFAGIYVQLIIFAITSILFSNFYDNSILLATFVSWNLLMVISNIIPVIKLDGYWILSNLVEIPNLYEKSFKLALGIEKEVLFNEREVSKRNFIRLFGFFNIVFVFVSIILGFISIYYFYGRLDGIFKYIALIIELLMYSLTLIFFSIFLYKIIKQKRNGLRRKTE